MNWSDVGGWLKENAGSGAALVGSLLTGNAPGVIAAGIAMVGSATGTNDPVAAMAALKGNPSALLKLRELAVNEESSIRDHIRTMEEMRLKDEQSAHEQQQQTIQGGDKSEDEYVSHTRPMMARQSWYATIFYTTVFEFLKSVKIFDDGASIEIAMLLLAPSAAYLGFRSIDKFTKK